MPDRYASPESLAAPGIPTIGDVVAGKYRVEGTLGSGGMGVVLSARHVTLGQAVAIKVLGVQDGQTQAEARARLLREARAAAALTSEHVVRIHDIGEDASGRPFIVMERLEGMDLADVLRWRGPLPVDVVAGLLCQACRALVEAHHAGIVHRDLKPSNLFVSKRSDGSAHVKVLDFGVAKSSAPADVQPETLTGSRMTLGSPAYMSPEQVRDPRQVDARADLWAIGVIAYELLTGKQAFQGNTLPGVCAAIVADAPTPPSVVRPGIPAALEQIVLRCLEKDKNARFQSAQEIALALEPFAARTIDFAALVPVGSLPATPPGASLPATLPMPYVDESEGAASPASAERANVSAPSVPAGSSDPTLASETPSVVLAARSHVLARGARTQRSPTGEPTIPWRMWSGVALVLAALGAAFLWWPRPAALGSDAVRKPPAPETTSFAPPAASESVPSAPPIGSPAVASEPSSQVAPPAPSLPPRPRPRPRAEPPAPSSAPPEIRLSR